MKEEHKQRAETLAASFGLTSLQALVLEGIFNEIHHNGWLEGFRRAQEIAENVLQEKEETAIAHI